MGLWFLPERSNLALVPPTPSIMSTSARNCSCSKPLHPHAAPRFSFRLPPHAAPGLQQQERPQVALRWQQQQLRPEVAHTAPRLWHQQRPQVLPRPLPSPRQQAEPRLQQLQHSHVAPLLQLQLSPQAAYRLPLQYPAQWQPHQCRLP